MSHSPLERAVRRILRSRPIVTSALLAVAVASQAQAQNLSRTVDFDIKPQKLSTALIQFSNQAGVQLIMPGRIGENPETQGVRGALSIDTALTRLLAGTELTFQVIGENIVGIERKESGTAKTDRTADNAVLLEEVVVRAIEFREDEVSSATKMPLSAKDTPQSVKVITQDLIDFAGIQRFQDFYKIDASSGPSHSGDQYPSRNSYYRGFQLGAMTVDGFRVPPLVQLDLAPFERFEVIKGPTSTIYGQNSVGGTLTAVSKQPKSEFGGAVSLETGSYDHYRADADIYGALNDDASLTYRLVAGYLDENAYVDFAYDRRTVVVPSVKYEFNDDTSVLARVYYQYSDFGPYNGPGTQFIGGSDTDPANYVIPDVPEDRTGNSPWNRGTKESTLAQALLDHRMGEWTLKASAQYGKIDKENDGVLMFSTDELGQTDAVVYRYDFTGNSYLGEVNLFGDFEAFGRKQTLFVGADYAEWDFDYTNPSNYLPGSSSGFSILDPDYDLLRPPTNLSDYTEHFAATEKHKRSGATVQMLIRPIDGLIVNLGGRYSHTNTATAQSCCAATSSLVPNQELTEDAFTYQAGVTYALTPLLNAYANYGTTFEPQSGFVAAGVAIAPEEGKAYEFGLKGETASRKLSYSLALFNMERTNIAQVVAGTPYREPVGVQRSRGVELEFQGQVVRGWQVFGSIATIDAEYIEGQYKGIQPINAPKFGISAFTSYEIQNGVLRGLGFGGGVVHKRDRDTTVLGSNIPILLFDDFTEVELRVFYSLPQWQFDLGVSNALDDRYYSAPRERLNFGYQISPPREVNARVRYKFGR
jgi:TonB-dependent siderophore receptor